MTTFIDTLFAASADESLSPAELRALLRRAALKLKEVAPATDEESQAFFDDARSEAGDPIEHGFPPEREPHEYRGHWSERREEEHEDPDGKADIHGLQRE